MDFVAVFGDSLQLSKEEKPSHCLDVACSPLFNGAG